MSDEKSIRRCNGFKDLNGRRFGKLEVVELAEWHITPAGKKLNRWRCQCDCGAEVCVVTASLLKPKGTRSCGCYRSEWTLANKTTHRREPLDLWRCWCHIRARCHAPGNKQYRHYGGRGIKVCERWRNSFESFVADMGPKPTPQHSIDRIDNDGDYCPENCRWATPTMQARNKRNSTLITFDGETLPLAAWAERLGMSYGVLRHRLDGGWPVQQAFTHPVETVQKLRSRNRRAETHRMLTHDGLTLCMSEWAERVGIGNDTLFRRLSVYGWSVERALTTPVRRLRKRSA